MPTVPPFIFVTVYLQDTIPRVGIVLWSVFCLTKVHNIVMDEKVVEEWTNEECNEDVDGEIDKGEEDKIKDHIAKREFVNDFGATCLVPYVGMEFASDGQAFELYNAYAKYVGFSVRRYSTRKSRRDGTILSRQFVCYRHGFREQRYVNRADRKRKVKAITRTGCEATLLVNKRNNGKWVVRKFVEEHNHNMVTGIKVHLLPSHRRIHADTEDEIDKRGCPSSRTTPAVKTMAIESGRSSTGNVGRDPRNYIMSSLPTKRLEKGEREILIKYFERLHAENPGFFFAVGFDKENDVTNFLWVDARSRMDYCCFGDVVTFDTTYNTNGCKMPFASFMGVNNHQQSVLFGCALLYDDTEASLVWLFETWLKSMLGRHPISMITDQDQSMTTAVAQVFPQTCHRFCLRHIFQNATIKAFSVHEDFAKDFRKCIYTRGTIVEFESQWVSLLEKYNARDNVWLKSMYEKREKWVPTYLRHTFFADTSTTHHSDSINSYFDGYVDMKVGSYEFIKQYERAIFNQRGKENEEDYRSNDIAPKLKSVLPMEEEAAKLYTRTIFVKFQEELFRKDRHIADKIEDDGTAITYRVTNHRKQGRGYTVNFNASETRANCSCQKFEFAGILCRHILLVFRMSNVISLPLHYVLRRWTKHAKPGDALEVLGIEMQGDDERAVWLRHYNLMLLSHNILSKGAKNAKIYDMVVCGLQHISKELDAAENDAASRQHENIELGQS
ncbi:protein FAR1-RELATED SEQUENCE 5-like isoform X2 [Magnolia sinica]|uniref:protein FAR1-RELATED SEQUENCE 5-like isoform X2 n=1 Tax=Magnolia sinica TaxID=86752 RepID=UPI002659E4F1|nr:protein FAR1-RELATED SEQUENCE 5-like isoform X2 [Magnolia sinica]